MILTIIIMLEIVGMVVMIVMIVMIAILIKLRCVPAVWHGHPGQCQAAATELGWGWPASYH